MCGVPSVVILTRTLENSGRVPLGSARTALAPAFTGLVLLVTLRVFSARKIVFVALCLRLLSVRSLLRTWLKRKWEQWYVQGWF